MKKCVVVIPTYNELKNIEPLLIALSTVATKVHSKWKLEVLIVDDSSPDGTAAEAVRVSKTLTAQKQHAGLKRKSIHILLNPDKEGLGKAYILGLDYAVSTLHADVVGQFDADLSHDPYKIPELLSKIDQGFDMVIGSRYITGGSIPGNWGWYRKLLSKVGNTLVRFGLGHPEIRDWSTGFRVFTKEVYQKIRPKITEEQFFGYLIMVGILHSVVKSKFTVTEVPFQFVDRTYGESKLGVDYIIATLTYIATNRVRSTLKDLNKALKFPRYIFQ